MSDIKRKAAAFDWLSQFEYFKFKYDIIGLIDQEKPNDNNLNLIMPFNGRMTHFKGNNLLECVEEAQKAFNTHKWLAAAIKVDQDIKTCQAGRDGDCFHKLCPQLRDNEPHTTGRHCPLDSYEELI